MKVGIMGGTFDPIHTGHLIAAETARAEAGLDEVWFLPNNVPPHKAGNCQTDALHRWNMVVRAVAGNPYFRASDLEIRKGGVSYTVETVRLLKQQYPSLHFSYIIGGDMVAYLPQWFQIEEIVRHISFIGLQRPGYPLELEALPLMIRQAVSVVSMPEIGISSTEIRERRSAGRSIRYWVADSVFEYIEVNRLYES
jgi:nicotinate-nucleotide adenylyltransferase